MDDSVDGGNDVEGYSVGLGASYFSASSFPSRTAPARAFLSSIHHSPRNPSSTVRNPIPISNPKLTTKNPTFAMATLHCKFLRIPHNRACWPLRQQGSVFIQTTGTATLHRVDHYSEILPFSFTSATNISKQTHNSSPMVWLLTAPYRSPTRQAFGYRPRHHLQPHRIARHPCTCLR